MALNDVKKAERNFRRQTLLGLDAKVILGLKERQKDYLFAYYELALTEGGRLGVTFGDEGPRYPTLQDLARNFGVAVQSVEQTIRRASNLLGIQGTGPETSNRI